MKHDQNRLYLVHKTNSNTFKRIEIIQNVFSDHSGIKPEVSNKKITGKDPNTWKLNYIFLNNPLSERGCFVGNFFKNRT